MIKKTKHNNKKGFTLLETLVAIFILLLAVTGPMVFAQNSLKAAYLSRDQITSFYLAQDIIETIKNVRENNFIRVHEGDPVFWLDGISGLLEDCSLDDGSEGGCSLDQNSFTDSRQYRPCKDGDYAGCNLDNPLQIDSNGNFNISSGEPSRFSRKVYLDPVYTTGGDIEDIEEIRVIVEVEFNTTNGPRKILVQENIYNWFQ